MISGDTRTVEPPTRRAFLPGEWLTLLGMVLAVVGVSLKWPNPSPPMPRALAVYVSRRPQVAIGFDIHLGWLNIGWTIVVCAVACGAILLWEPAPRWARLALGLQVVLGLVALGLAATRLGAQAGVIASLVGAILLLWGAAARWSKEPVQR